MKKKIKNERGSMTAYAAVCVFSFMTILLSVFLTTATVRKNQIKTLLKIKEVYEQDLENKDRIYASLLPNDKTTLADLIGETTASTENREVEDEFRK